VLLLLLLLLPLASLTTPCARASSGERAACHAAAAGARRGCDESGMAAVC
jgi:hypothetical protein